MIRFEICYSKCIFKKKQQRMIKDEHSKKRSGKNDLG